MFGELIPGPERVQDHFIDGQLVRLTAVVLSVQVTPIIIPQSARRRLRNVIHNGGLDVVPCGTTECVDHDYRQQNAPTRVIAREPAMFKGDISDESGSGRHLHCATTDVGLRISGRAAELLGRGVESGGVHYHRSRRSDSYERGRTE